nr:alanine--glyoxylate aminotransferase family protein [Desulfobacterales bacterium]
MKKRYLMAPGPTPVPPNVRLAMAEPLIHHRSPQFSSVFAEVQNGLQYLFQTQNEVLTFAASGTGAMDGAVSNLLSVGDKVLVVRGGKFGERWAEICEAYGLNVENIDLTWGEAVDPDAIAEKLSTKPDIRAIFVQAHETSTGVKHDVKKIGQIVKDFEDTILIVDAISALGVFDVKTDDWHLDVVVSGSQKGLMLPPGLAFVSISPKAWEFADRSDLPKYYFNFLKERKSLVKNQTAFTSPVSLVMGLREVLKMIKAEGLDFYFFRHRLLAKATRAAAKAMGLDTFAKVPSEGVTVFRAPDGIDAQEVVRIVREKYGITIAGGQARLKGKIFRIAHMGYIGPFDIILTVSAVEMALKELGHALELGAGVKAVQEVVLKEWKEL